jgi:hypothetical protein
MNSSVDVVPTTGSYRVGVLRLLLGLVVLAALAGVVTGGRFVVEDLSEHGDMFDGLGAAIGALILTVSVLAGVLSVVAAVLAVRRPTVARVVSVVLALGLAGLVYPLAVETDWGVWLFPFPLALVVVAVLPDGRAR